MKIIKLLGPATAALIIVGTAFPARAEGDNAAAAVAAVRDGDAVLRAAKIKERRAAFLARFDADGDGKLSADERKKARAARRHHAEDGLKDAAHPRRAADRLEDKFDRREDRRDKREDVRDRRNGNNGPKDRIEDVRDRREDVRDRVEDRRDRRHHGRVPRPRAKR